ncbi:MAG: glycosyltransferase 87 family protein [Candidatus Altiarchaeota archaeon]
MKALDRENVIALFFYLTGLFLIVGFGAYQVVFWMAYLIFSAGFLFLIRHKPKINVGRETRALILLFVLALGLRLAFLWSPPQLSLDLEAYATFGKLMLDGKSPFIGTHMSSYPPLIILFFPVVYLVDESIFFMRLVMVLADSIIPLLIFMLSKKYLKTNLAFLAALFYAINPVSIIEVGWSGHFDPLPSLFMLLSLYLLTERRFAASSVSLAVASMLKWYPIFILPVFIASMKKEGGKVVNYLAIFMIVCLLSFAPLFILFPDDFSSALMNRVMNAETSYSRSLTKCVYDVSQRILPLGRDIRPLVFHILIGFAVLASLAYLTGRRNIFKKLFVVVCILFIAHMTLFSIINLYALFTGYGNMHQLSRLYLISFSAITLFFLIKLTKHVQSRDFNTQNQIAWIALILQILIIAQPNFAGKYFIWIIPFILLLKDEKIRDTWLMVQVFSLPIFYYGPPYFAALLP